MGEVVEGEVGLFGEDCLEVAAAEELEHLSGEIGEKNALVCGLVKKLTFVRIEVRVTADLVKTRDQPRGVEEFETEKDIEEQGQIIGVVEEDFIDLLEESGWEGLFFGEVFFE